MVDETVPAVREDISDVASDPRQLRKETEETVLFFDGEYGGYTEVKAQLNLNALAIGLGLEKVEYEPDLFAGLVYRTDSNATVILFWDGQITVTDAPSESTAENVIREVVEKVRQLGITDGLPTDVSVEISKTEIDESVPSIEEY